MSFTSGLINGFRNRNNHFAGLNGLSLAYNNFANLLLAYPNNAVPVAASINLLNSRFEQYGTSTLALMYQTYTAFNQILVSNANGGLSIPYSVNKMQPMFTN